MKSVSEFDFDQNVREMLGNFVSDCDICGKSPQFHEIIQRRCHTPAYILSVGYMGLILFTHPEFVSDWSYLVCGKAPKCC